LNRTNDNVEWAWWTWNPVTGCLRNCPYCYARDISTRFTGDFKPTFHEERLSAPRNTHPPRNTKVPKDPSIGAKNVFVCSMADLFGEWVPCDWIDKVLAEVTASPQWNFLFLSKNPARMTEFTFPHNAWVGTTVDVQSRVKPAQEAFRDIDATVKFLSCEPLLEELTFDELEVFDWVIIGGRSRNSRGAASQPEWRWVERLFVAARAAGCKVYFKPNLTARPREYPDLLFQAQDEE